ncbi:MCE-family Mce3F domain protein [Mycobacterium xenopi 3993]|nr:MCE-family Mce3F domain protein [Mycobacterium xenopi 3993]
MPIVLANLVSVGQVGVTYRDNLESLLVELPQGAADIQAVGVANRNTKQDYNGAYLSFNLNLNWPPPCTTGFLPAQQQRAASYEDYPDVPNGDFYCRVPQDSLLNVRGARNLPCETRPGKRARRSNCAKATRPTCRSTTASTGRAIRTRPIPARVSRSSGQAKNRRVRRDHRPSRSATTTDRSGPVRSRHRYVRRTRRADVHPSRAGPRRRKGADMAEHADPPTRK